MTRKTILYILCGLCFIMPIVSVEGIVPWIITIFIVSRSFKQFEKSKHLKQVILNTICCGGAILIYNILARNIEAILVKMFM